MFNYRKFNTKKNIKNELKKSPIQTQVNEGLYTFKNVQNGPQSLENLKIKRQKLFQERYKLSESIAEIERILYFVSVKGPITKMLVSLTNKRIEQDELMLKKLTSQITEIQNKIRELEILEKE